MRTCPHPTMHLNLSPEHTAAISFGWAQSAGAEPGSAVRWPGASLRCPFENSGAPTGAGRTRPGAGCRQVAAPLLTHEAAQQVARHGLHAAEHVRRPGLRTVEFSIFKNATFRSALAFQKPVGTWQTAIMGCWVPIAWWPGAAY